MKKMIAGILAILLCFCLFGCTESPAPTTEATEPPVSTLYTQAAQPLRDAQNIKLELTIQKDIITLDSAFSSSSQQELLLSGLGTDGFSASMTESLKIGENEKEFTEYFANDVLYIRVADDGYFQGDMTAEKFISRFAPAVLLDETLYADISATASDSGTTVTFSQSAAAEAWALPEGAKFISASGTAEISPDGTLTQTVYTVDYTHGSTYVTMDVTAKATVYDGAAPEAPQNPYRFNKIESIEAPRLYDTAVMYLYASQSASSTMNRTIVSQAAGYTQTEQVILHYTGADKDHTSQVQRTLNSLTNTGATDSYVLEENFKDGKCTYAENGGLPTLDPSVDAEEMFAYIQGYFDDNLQAINYFSSAKTEDLNGLIYLEMELNPDWGNQMSKYLCYALFEDENFLDAYATDYVTSTASYYMCIDPATGFPVSAGTTFAGIHTIEGQQFVLGQDITQNYLLADSSTYTKLTGELLPESEPEQQATPLLYKVTGANGQEMYLMGTIHVGNDKTGFLPQEVYDAFDASDALAVEADVLNFEEKMETDPQLAMQVAAVLTNPTGTKSMLNEDLYKAAVKLLKASGNYTTNMEYMQPFVWNNTLDSFYLTFGSLRAEKGMDMRLLRLAQEKNKTVLEVESALLQYQMMADFSPELQALLLEETLSCNVTEYCQDVQDLYELWCAGDEAALRKMLNDETAEMTDAEKSLYQEYINAMIIERNDAMLQVAISYLESDDTVFYAVGLAHLLQENGLVDTLRDAGYTVEQVIYN